MTTVLVFGTFDIIHPGHRWFLTRAGRLGDRLVAVVSRDEFVREWKGRSPVSNAESRIRALEASGLVDQAVLADPAIRTYGVLRRLKPDVICLGHDQRALKDDLERWLTAHADDWTEDPQELPSIQTLPPWKRRRYSSSRLNQNLMGAGERREPAWVLYAMMTLATALFGLAWVSGKRISSAAPPLTLAFLRFVLTLALLLPMLAARVPVRLRRGRTAVGLVWTASAAGALAAFNLLFFGGLGISDAVNGALMVTAVSPLLTFVMVAATGSIRCSRSTIPGLLIGAIGGMILFKPRLGSDSLIFFGAALAWSFLTVAGRRAVGILGFRVFSVLLYGTAALGSFAVLLVVGAPVLPMGLELGFWLDMAVLVVGAGAFGTGAYFVASTRLGDRRIRLFTFLIPASALVFTTVLLAESPDPWVLAGAVFTLAGVVLIDRAIRSQREAGSA